MKEILRPQKSRPFLAKFISASLLGVSAGYCHRALMDESGMFRTQMETLNRLEDIVLVLGTPCAIPPLRKFHSGQYQIRCTGKIINRRHETWNYRHRAIPRAIDLLLFPTQTLASLAGELAYNADTAHMHKLFVCLCADVHALSAELRQPFIFISGTVSFVQSCRQMAFPALALHVGNRGLPSSSCTFSR
jgi:hypothetical protein